MKQHTTVEQTFKLISLGCDKPKHFIEGPTFLDSGYAYTIGELFEMLPRTIKSYYDLSVLSTSQGWWVLYGMIGDGDMWAVEYELYNNELIDALYDMVVKLKEEGVI